MVNIGRHRLSGGCLPLAFLLVRWIPLLSLCIVLQCSMSSSLHHGVHHGAGHAKERATGRQTTTWDRNRRQLLQFSLILPLAVAEAALPVPASAKDTAPHLAYEYYHPNIATNEQAGRYYFPALTPPFRNRATYRYELGRGQWAFEQLLSFANVTATIRMTVVELKSTGGLWVHSPQYPTGELMALLLDLGKPIQHIVLPCNAFEHKAPMKDFCNKFPDAQVWISPGQYGPFGSCGQSRLDPKQPCRMGYRVDGILGSTDCQHAPWLDEFEMATLYVDLPENAGPVSEVAFCHKPTRTLIVTDAVIFVPSQGPPPIFSTYFEPSTLENDPNFWAKSVLQAVFLPLRQEEKEGGLLRTDDTTTIPNARYPGFDALCDRLIRAPILRAFSDARAPEAARKWIDTISTWDYNRIVTSHFASPIQLSSQGQRQQVVDKNNDVSLSLSLLRNGGAGAGDSLREAFGYLYEPPQLEKLPPIQCRDWELLEGLNQVIATQKLGAVATFDYSRGCK